MDWLDPTDDERVLIGVIKLAAKSKDKRCAPVFVNPGVCTQFARYFSYTSPDPFVNRVLVVPVLAFCKKLAIYCRPSWAITM